MLFTVEARLLIAVDKIKGVTISVIILMIETALSTSLWVSDCIIFLNPGRTFIYAKNINIRAMTTPLPVPKALPIAPLTASVISLPTLEDMSERGDSPKTE